MGTPILETGDASATLSIVNHPATRLPGPNLLQLLIHESSQDGQPAIDFLASEGDRISLSYAEFHHASETLASRISALAGRLEDSRPFVVPVLIPQSPELYIALLAILKAGAAFCPMDLDVPLERAKFILEDVSAKVVITTSDLASRLPQGGQRLLIVDGEAPDESPAAAAHRQAAPSDLAYVMYTSGSTGTPKGVGVSHDAVTQSLLAHDRHIPQFSRFLQFAAPTFDVSVFEIFFPFFRGKTLVSCTRPAMLNDLPAVIETMSVDACELTPSVAGSLLRKRDNAPGLGLLLTIGEMLTQPVIKEFGGDDRWPSMLWGMYGPTEAAIHCTLQPAFARDSTTRNIGIPLDTVSAFILKIPEEDYANSEFKVLPRGEVGELVVGGYQLAEGYLNRPEQTSSAFVKTPYGRLYRTGDKARMLPDGTLECLGRIADGQVKLRGQRMELGEVEHAALRTTGCHSAVAAIADATLVLFCAVEGTGDMTAAITQSCRRWLPGFMLPGDIVVVDNFPRLASGKVDRKQLVAGYKARAAESPNEISYKDGLEAQLCDLTSCCLGVTVHPNQDLPKAGLDSLSAIKLASVLREAGLLVGAIDVLEARTVSTLYSRLQSSAETRDTDPVPTAADPIELDIADILAHHSILSKHNQPIEAVIPCTPLQASMLAETMANPRAYCNWMELGIDGTLSEESVRSWFLQLAQANEILRTGFIHHEGQFLQIVFKTFDETHISTPAHVVRGFEIRDELEFLCPVRIQIFASSAHDDTRVTLQLHHAVYDGWSLDLLLSDFARLARGEHLGSKPQFRQIATYHQSTAFKESCDVTREFWAGNLLGFQPATLPILTSEVNNTPAVLTSTISLNINPKDLKTALQRFDCGPQTIFQAALAWLWSSMVGSEDVVVGSIQSGRTMPISRVEEIVGPCIAAVPLRTDLSQVRTIKDLLVSVHTGNRAALPHTGLPLSEIRRIVGIHAGQPLYDVLFIYQESLHNTKQNNEIVKRIAHQDYLETKLLVEVEPLDDVFECRFTYHSDVFPEAQVDTMADSIVALVAYMLENLDSEIKSMVKAVPHHLLSIFNPNPQTFSGVPDLAHAVECIAADFPDKDAVCFADHIADGVLTTTTITFAELNNTAEQIAWHLGQQGVQEGGVVTIIMEKSIRLYAGILAILKLGCAYLPLLPSTPEARIETIVQQAEVKACVVDTATREKLTHRLNCDFFDIQSLDLRSTPTSRVNPKPDPDRLAYIIYTSGSTGVPKGVCLTQLNIMNNLDVLSRIYPVGEDSRFLQSCSQAFDVSVFEIFFAWTQGMCLCSGTNDTLFEDLERSIRKLHVTHLSMTPTVASLVDPTKVPRVRFLVTAGEAMTDVVAQKWQDKLYQGYGPSETTNICSVKKMGPNPVVQHLGWSFENTSTFVLARDNTDIVPFGCLGEFCFGGDQVAQGYLGMEDLTSARFISHPTFGRIYRSGDLGRMLPDGSMVIVGRADEQIKIRGQRVELNEITEAIRQAGNAADCATLFLRGHDTGSQDQIISFLVPEQHEGTKFQVLAMEDKLSVHIQTLYHALASRLPAYMAPSAIIPISVLPTTTSGKLDRARLKQAFKDIGNDYLALISHGAELNADDGEWSTVEIEVAKAVCSALNVDMSAVKRWTPLGTLGLDSISAIQASKHLHTRLGGRLPISLILQNGSVVKLAKALLGTDISGPRQEELPELLSEDLVDTVTERLEQLGKPFTKILPCTPLQEAMLATSTGKGQYLNRTLFRVNGDSTRLKEAWNAMCARHDILRTCFVATDDTQWPILQVVLGQWQAPWNDFDASRSSIGDCVSQHAQGVPNALHSFQPAVSFATITQDDSVLLSFICHHALYDGVAIERLLYEVEQHVSGCPLPPAPIYDQFLRESLALPRSTDIFWLQHLAGHEPKLTTHLSSQVAATQSRSLSSCLDIPLSQIQTRVRELGVSLLALTQSAWATALGCLFQTGDICFGSRIEELVAPCFNTIPIRMDLSCRQRNLDLMKAFQSANTELMEYQFTPLRRIQSLFSQNGHRRFFDTLLLLQTPSRVLNQDLWTMERDEGEMDVPLVCEAVPDIQKDRLTVKMHTMESCLRFPGSRMALDDMPQGLGERLSLVQLQQPQPDITAAHDESDSTSGSWTATESSIRTVLATLSAGNPERVRRDTTIYQLGLDSISAVQIASMLRKLGHEVVASDVIEHPTCGRLARYMDTRATSSWAVATYDLVEFQAQIGPQVLAHGIPVDHIEAVLPCTPLQSAMMAQFMKSGGRDYFNYVDFELEDSVSTMKVAEAWRNVSAAHPILRTAIVPVEHDDCAFAMVQYHDCKFVPVIATISRDTETFDYQTWRLDASRAAAEASRKALWSIAIVENKKGATMHLAIHHALYDAHSLQLILDDLSIAVAGGRIPRHTRIDSVAVDILGQITTTAEVSAEFWKKQASHVVINGFPVMTPLQETTREILTESTMTTIPLATLEEAASASGHTLQVILQAAWSRVLSAYLGEDSVVFGVVLSGRNTEATHNAVFPCITTLPVVSAHNGSNHSLLTQMLQYNTELYKQQHQPLTRIQQWLGCPESRLFDTLLVYQKLDRDTAAHRPWRVVDEIASVDYPVSIEVEPKTGGQLGYQITFFSDVLAKEQALLLLKQFDATVQNLALHPEGHEEDLFQLHPDLFSALSPETPEIPTTVQFLHQFVELQALQAPDTAALHFVERFDGDLPVGRKWSYKELNDNGNRVAQLLLPRAITGDIIAVYFDKCPEAYFSILGILKAGCAFVALDPGAPRSRNEFILEDSGASVLITSKQLRDNLNLAVSAAVIDIDEGSLSSAPADPPSLRRELQPSDVCYCLYTSGTTGQPKGCEITHDNAVQCMLAFQHIFKGHWQEDSKWLQFASLHFDVSVLEQYWSWSVGITLVAAPRDLILEDLAGTISRLQITHIDLTPSLARLLHPDDVPSLCKGVFITGGESLKQEILDAWGSKGVIYNFYGPTEATIGVTVFPRVPTTGRASNIGQQFVNVGSYVLKPGTEQPVLRGGVGELCVSGRLVGKGYLKREDLTSEKFPTLQHSGERVYRTGDLVRVLHDGCFDFLGRADDQVKLRGQRLEVGEINHAIRKGVQTVKDVATLVVRNEAQQKVFLVSFIVVDDEGTRKRSVGSLEIVSGPEAEELCRYARDACRSRLPGYMVPTYVFQLPFIPLSANNKAEIKTLRKLFASLGQEKLISLSSSTGNTGRILRATGTRVVKAIATMQAIDPGSVTPESSIFELGIDSVSVLRFARALKKDGFAQATPSLILRHPLVGALATALETPKSASKPDFVAAAKQLVQACGHRHRLRVCQELGVTPDEIEYIAPCSPLQQGMISRSATDSAYFNTFQFILSPKVSAKELHDAFQRAVDELPILRTRFVGTTDGFVQTAMKNLLLPWKEIQADAETSTEDAIRKTRDIWITRNQECFAQPLEAVLITGEGARLLVLHIFHALYDANSFTLVLRRVAAEYSALSGESSQGTAFTPGPSFLDALCYGPLQDFDSSRPFWLEHLAGATAVSVPSRSPTPCVITQERNVPFEGLEALRTSVGVTHQALVQAAWVSILSKRSSADPTIGIIVSGRNIELDRAERVVGPLFNALPFRARFSTDDQASRNTWKSLIRQCHDFNTAVFPFQHVSLRDIQKWCSEGQALFDTLFSFQREEEPTDKDGILWTVVDSEPNADYPLALDATLGSDGCLRLLIVAQKGDDDSTTMLSAMMDELEQTFAAMSNNPNNLVHDHSSEMSSRVANEVTTNGHATNRHTTNQHTTNEHPTTSQPTESAFTWTETTVMIRNEIAALAEANPETVTETTPLFGLGLDSIDIIKLCARLKRHGVRIKASELMKAQTVTGIMELHQTRARNTNANGVEVTSTARMTELATALHEHLTGLGELGDGEIALPTTPTQEAMVVDMIESDFQLYFNHDILEIGPAVDISKLKDAWRTVIAGSPILRTTFLPVENPSFRSSYCQVIATNPSVHMVDVGLNNTDELAKVCDTATLRARKGAGQSNLLQLVFASVGSQRFLVLSIAHALYDGWSLGLIHQGVKAAYQGRYTAKEQEFYLDQLQGILSPEQYDAPTFWSGFLQGATPTMFPLAKVDINQSHLVHREEMTSSLSSSKIVSFCKANAVTLQTLGQACWAALLAAETQSLDITFGVVLSCRDTESLEQLVFPTMNTVAVRSILHGTISSWLRYMQDNMANIGTHQHFPLREVQKLAKSNGPLFNTLFIQQRALPSSHQQANETLMQSVEMEMTEGNLAWQMACDGAYASQDKTARMLQEVDQILTHLVLSTDGDVLIFSEKGVSICGLPPISLKAADSTLNSTANGSADGSDSWSLLEETIRGVLAEVSRVPTTAILKSNNIYHLGLDSISAVKAGSLLRKKGVTIGFRDMLKAGSISDMARVVRDARSSSTASDAANGGNGVESGFAIPEEVDLSSIASGIRIDESMVEEVLPATPMQVHLLSVWQNTKGEVFYPSFRYTLSGRVDSSAIDAAWKALVVETPILRTIFVSTNSRATPVLQVVIHSSALDQTSASADDTTTWDSRTASHLSQPYNSLHAEKDGDNWTIGLKIHHALYDAVSLPTIMGRFAALCTNSDQPPACATFNWRHVITPHFSETNRAARKQFWSDYLAGAAQSQLPCLRQGEEPGAKSRVCLVKQAALQQNSSLVELCKARGVSLQALFFAAYAEFIACTAANGGNERPERMVFGIYLANRSANSELGASSYPFLRLVPLRVVLTDGLGLFDVAAEIQRDIHALSAPVNVEVGLWEIKDWTGVTVDSFVNFLAAPEPPVEKMEEREVQLELVGEPVAESAGISANSCEPHWEGEGEGREIACNPVRDAFPEAIDVEVSVQGGGMTIGVFGPSQRLGHDGAVGIIEGVVEVLRGLFSFA
ncbi:hypothetical protein C8A00DRAFT_43310 [Chaetomidium leptoderma]|uniref:Carrier domain-containing protein n=1 Tax=Chaetomidium leptoderma TaxID=669021 RepID=A0AAN6VM89_9PEZI|nr:hypothetical protein C8A00DRAFT_43310 [Chaetomidium leptoderma]